MEFKKKLERPSKLTECKVLFAVGTKVSNRNLDCGCVFKILKDSQFYDSGNDIMVKIPKQGSYTVYRNGIFADIIH